MCIRVKTAATKLALVRETVSEAYALESVQTERTATIANL